MQCVEMLEHFGIVRAAMRDDRGRCVTEVVEIMRFQMDDVIRQRVFRRPVIFRPTAEKNDGEAQVGKSPDDLVDPARDTAADVGKGSLEQQGDVGVLGTGEIHARLQ